MLKRLSGLLLVLVLIAPAPLLSASLEELRKQQTLEMNRLERDYAARAKGLKGEAYDRLLEEYSRKRREIRERYRGKDPRTERIRQIEQRYKGEIANTGSYPKDVQSDVDLTAGTDGAADRLAEEWRAQGHRVEDMGYKVVDHDTDTVLWRPSTPERIEAMQGDWDAYQTTGGRKSTGSVRDPRSFSGAGLDPSRKMLHAASEGDLKTMGKGFAKLKEQAYGTLRFEKSAKDGPMVEKRVLKGRGGDTYDQCKKLQAYQDPVEAGIYRLDDPPEVRKRKLEAFKRRMFAEAQQAQRDLDLRSQRQEEALRALRDSVQDPELKARIQRRLEARIDSNRRARKEIQAFLKKNKAVHYDMPGRPGISTKTETTEEFTGDRKKRAAAGPVSREDMNARLRAGGMSAADWLVQAYMFNESVEQIEREAEKGEHDYVVLDRDDSVLERNAKVYGWALFTETPLGGAFDAGSRADREEQERILQAIREGRSTNAFVSWLRASASGGFDVVWGMAAGALDYTCQQLAGLVWEGQRAFKAWSEEADTLARNRMERKLLQARKRLRDSSLPSALIRSMLVTPEPDRMAHHAELALGRKPHLYVQYDLPREAERATLHLSALSARDGRILSRRTLGRECKGAGTQQIAWLPGDWDEEAGTVFQAEVVPNAGRSAGARVEVSFRPPLELPGFEITGTLDDYGGGAIDSPVRPGDVLAFRSVVPTPAVDTPLETVLHWAVYKDGTAVRGLAKREAQTVTGRPVEARFRFRLGEVPEGRYQVILAHYPVKNPENSTRARDSFEVTTPIAIRKLLVTDDPDVQEHKERLYPDDPPHFFVIYDLGEGQDAARVAFKVREAETGRVLSRRIVERPRREGDFQRVGLRMKPGSYPLNKPLAFEAGLSTADGFSRTEQTGFIIADYELELDVPGRLESGESGGFSITPPDRFEPPFRVSIDASGGVSAGYDRNALKGTLTAIGRGLETGRLRVTVTDSMDRTASAQAVVMVRGSPVTPARPGQEPGRDKVAASPSQTAKPRPAVSPREKGKPSAGLSRSVYRARVSAYRSNWTELWERANADLLRAQKTLDTFGREYKEVARLSKTSPKVAWERWERIWSYPEYPGLGKLIEDGGAVLPPEARYGSPRALLPWTKFFQKVYEASQGPMSASVVERHEKLRLAETILKNAATFGSALEGFASASVTGRPAADKQRHLKVMEHALQEIEKHQKTFNSLRTPPELPTYEQYVRSGVP